MEVGGNNFIAKRFIPNYNQLNLWPLQFLRTGLYNRSTGNIFDLLVRGYWWSGISGMEDNGHNLGSWVGGTGARSSNRRGMGFALRWVSGVIIFSIFNHLDKPNNRGKWHILGD